MLQRDFVDHAAARVEKDAEAHRNTIARAEVRYLLLNSVFVNRKIALLEISQVTTTSVGYGSRKCD